MRINLDITQGKVQRNLFFTADFHLFHKNVIRFDKRPFADVDEMHAAIEDGWNKTVTENDVVIYLGDLSFARREDQREVEALVKRLKGEIHYVLGNHDRKDDIRRMNRFLSIEDYLEVSLKHFGLEHKASSIVKPIDTLFTCFHYPIYSWNKGHHGSYMIHGHCHGNLHHGEDASFYNNRRVIDVGCMLTDYKPISYSEVIEKLEDVKLPTLTRSL